MRFGCFNGAAILLGIALTGTASAYPPDPSIDELIARLVETRKQIAEARKVESATAAELRQRLQDLTDRLKDLGIVPGPGPDPKPPEPVDPLAKRLRDAFASDNGKKDDALNLAALYRQAATLAKDRAVPSTAELLRRVREASITLIGPDALPTLRGVVAGELAKGLGAPTDAAFTEAKREAAAELFGRLAGILEGF